MVGYEPELNPPVDWAKEWREALKKQQEWISNLSLSKQASAVGAKPLIKPKRESLPGPKPLTPEVKATYGESLTTPLIQVFSVCISADFDDGKPCEIYGSVRVLEESQHRFDLYNRDPQDSETIWKTGTLSLIGPDGGAIIPSLGTELELCLYDRIRGVDVVTGTLNLDPMTEDSYDRLIKCDVEGPNGSASVYFVVFQFAIYASVQLSYDQQRPASLAPSVASPKSKVSYRGDPKVEVFTVFIGGITEKISTLCGTILVEDGGDVFSIYKRDESCYELLPDNGLACIEFNYRTIQNDEFAIILKLNDPVGKFQVSRGDLGWNVGTVQSGMLWYNKRLCSVVPGKDGFAAVHYAIFEEAIEAIVEVKVFANGHPDIPISLHGMLVARYSGHDYSTSYQKKYYISRLFDRPQDKPIELKSGSSIELLKSLVVVPIKSCLIIEANLRAFGTNNVDESIWGIEEFKFDLTGVSTSVIPGEELSGTMTRVIRGGDYWIEVSAKFQK